MATQKTWKISPATHKRVKIICAQEELTGEELAVRALDAYEGLSSTVQGSPSTGVPILGDDKKSSKRRAILQKIADLVEDAINAESGYQAERPGDAARTIADIEEVSQRLDEIEAAEKAAARTDSQRRKGGKRGGGA